MHDETKAYYFQASFNYVIHGEHLIDEVEFLVPLCDIIII
jgi:hypothetical protein